MENWNALLSLAQSVSGGKRIGSDLYLHQSLQRFHLPLPTSLMSLADERLCEWNCVKVSQTARTISFLHYADFETADHPILRAALTVHVETGRSRRIEYREDHNPPILHRKELLVGSNHPRYEEWTDLTKREESLGLYDNPRTIGFLDNWRELLALKGVSVAEPSLSPSVNRHLTAISRGELSKPVQLLLGSGLLNKETTLFDYGCGRGDDIARLGASGYKVAGWDPVHRPTEPKQSADVVNLGFVLNVIERPSERVQVLQDAFSLATSILCVSTLVENMQTAVNLKPYKDGYLTSRYTFQKYYQQSELAQFLEDVLQQPTAALGPGVFCVFKENKQAEAYFLAKTTRRASWTEWGMRPTWTKEERDALRRDRFYQDNGTIIEAFWNRTMELGRFPLEDEFSGLATLEAAAGGRRRVQEWLVSHFGAEGFENALGRKREDVVVYLALRHFQRRLPLREFPASMQRDIRATFPSYSVAWDAAKAHLFKIGKPEFVAERCDASKVGRGDEQALYVTPDEVDQLDPVLRIYVQTGELFYGDRFQADEIKIHKKSGKITFLEYDGDVSKKVTKFRTKVSLRDQRVEFYDHRKDGI